MIILILVISIIFVNGDSDSCAYSAMGMIATPLNSCSVYSMSETTLISYSSDYTFDAENNKLEWNYYSDSNCEKWYKSYEMDDIMMQIHHLNIKTSGSGSNCNTVDIKVKGSYSELMDECDPNIKTKDYYSRSYVTNECISSEMEGYSSILGCNKNEIYFDYYPYCTDCLCKSERYTFEYYAGVNDCYKVTCNSKPESYTSQSVFSHKTDAQFLKNLITKQANKPIFAPKKQTNIKPMVINGKIKAKNTVISRVSFWIYVSAAIFVFVIFCGVCRYINSFRKEYSQI